MPSHPKPPIRERQSARESGRWAFTAGLELEENPWPSKHDPRGWHWRQGWFAARRQAAHSDD